MQYPDQRLTASLMQKRLEYRARAGPDRNRNHAIARRWSWLMAQGQRIMSRAQAVNQEPTTKPVME